MDIIIVDNEFEALLDGFRKTHAKVRILVDLDSSEAIGPYEDAIREGLEYDREEGGRGWAGLETEVRDEESTIALPYTSGTTARPKGCIYTHRGAYLAALANVIESELNTYNPAADRCHYLWTLPM